MNSLCPLRYQLEELGPADPKRTTAAFDNSPTNSSADRARLNPGDFGRFVREIDRVRNNRDRKSYHGRLCFTNNWS